MSGQSVSTIQIINGQPLLQAKVQHILTPGGPMAVAVVPSSIGALLGPLLQQLPSGTAKNQTLFLNVSGGCGDGGGGSVLQTSVIGAEPSPCTSSGTVAPSVQTSSKGGNRRSRASRQRRPVVGNKVVSASGRTLSSTSCGTLYAPIKPKCVDAVPAYADASLQQQQQRPVILSTQQLPVGRSPVTVQLNESQQQEYGSVCEQIQKLSSAGLSSAYDEMVLQRLEHKRRAILERAANDQLRVNISVTQQQQTTTTVATPVVLQAGGAALSQLTIPVLNNSIGGDTDAQMAGVQQLVQINGNTYLLVQPNNNGVSLPAQNAFFVQTNFQGSAQQVVEHQLQQQPQQQQQQSVKQDVEESPDAPSCSPMVSIDRPVGAGQQSIDWDLKRMESVVMDQKRAVVEPDCVTPFRDLDDVHRRLQAYHLLYEMDFHPAILDAVDELYEQEMQQLLEAKRRLYNAHRLYLLRNTAKAVPIEDYILLDRLFLEAESQDDESDAASEEEVDRQDDTEYGLTAMDAIKVEARESALMDAVQSSECLSSYLMALHEPHSPLSSEVFMEEEDPEQHPSSAVASPSFPSPLSSSSLSSSGDVPQPDDGSTQQSGLKIVIKLNKAAVSDSDEPGSLAGAGGEECSRSPWSSSSSSSRSAGRKVPPLKLRISRLNFNNCDDNVQSPGSVLSDDLSTEDGDDDDEEEEERQQSSSEAVVVAGHHHPPPRIDHCGGDDSSSTSAGVKEVDDGRPQFSCQLSDGGQLGSAKLKLRLISCSAAKTWSADSRCHFQNGYSSSVDGSSPPQPKRRSTAAAANNGRV